MLTVWDLVISFYLGGVVQSAVMEFAIPSEEQLWRRVLGVLVWPYTVLLMLINPVTPQEMNAIFTHMLVAEPTNPTDGIIQIHWLDPKTGQTEFVAQGGDFIDDAEMGTWALNTYKRLRDTCPVGWEPIVITAASREFLLAKA